MAKRKRSTRSTEWTTRKEVLEARKRRQRKSMGPSLEALAGVAAALPLGYLAIEGIMNDGRHPAHWVITAAVGVAGLAIGEGVHRWKERV